MGLLRGICYSRCLSLCLIYHNKRMISTSFIRKSNGYCCIKKQMVLCTIFMQSFGLKIAWKSAVCHEKNCVRKEFTFSYTVLFLDIYKYFTISQGTPHYPISNRVHTVAYFLLLFFFLHLCPVILGIRKYKLYRKGRSQVIRSVSFCLRLAK